VNRQQRRKGEKLIKEIVGDDKLRAEKCLSEINAVLEKYDCLMIPKIILTNGNVDSVVQIAPKPRGQLQ
jgi:hypothetical protein